MGFSKNKYNSSGCYDPTAMEAINNLNKDRVKTARDVIKTMQTIAHIGGFEVVNRIQLRDKESGEIWR